MPDEAVEGLQSLLETMEGLPLVLQKNLIVRALRKGTEPIRQRAAELAPDDPETPRSRIAESMSIQITDQTAIGAIALIGPSRLGFMGVFAEIGTAHQSATPFLQPAFDQKNAEAYDLLEEELGTSIEKEWVRRAM